jgi:hypothetical protein
MIQALILAFNVPCLLKKYILVIAHIQLIMVLIVCLPISAFDYIMANVCEDHTSYGKSNILN